MNRNIAYCCFFLIILLTGCMAAPAEDLYSLPEMSTSYSHLQELVNKEIDSGSEFAGPITGLYRQSIHFYDINSDGNDEAFVFFRTSGSFLKICVYDRNGNDYSLKTAITGEGSSIWRIDFADLNGDGISEIIVTWQISSGLRLLNVYGFSENDAPVLISYNCTDFQIADMNRDGSPDIILFQLNSPNGENGNAKLLLFPPGHDPVVHTASLSKGLYSIERVKTGSLSDGVFAMFIEGKYAGSSANISEQFITDIVTYKEGGFRNISLDSNTGISRTIRKGSDNAYIGDPNNDKIIDVPEAVRLYTQPGQTRQYSALDWYSFSSTGEKQLTVSTYHSTEGWYLTLTPQWRKNLTVRRDEVWSGERGVVLSFVDPETKEINDFMIIYTLTGDNRHDRAHLADRFLLLDEGATIFVGKILMDKSLWNGALSEAEIKSRFKIIHTEWSTGALQ